ncbi:hypothetical protein THRCLA_00664 [Thraustotheca clavata]|uniref:UDENN domain-containing protein n=1 Tax=Thraustotheca clavata TaxID=74557 RepID=A0A1W0AAH6_9STRA|nr:hypothetical protein THRCLA_00664 [Thraustotheca clavata]
MNIRGRAATPTKPTRSPARNFRDMWHGSKGADYEPKAKSAGNVKATRRQWFFESEQDKAEQVPVQTIEETLKGDARNAYSMIASWCKDNSIPLTANENCIEPSQILSAFDSILDAIDQQDNQLTCDLSEMDEKIRHVRILPERRRSNSIQNFPSPFQIRMPELTTDNTKNSMGEHASRVMDTLFVIGPDITDLLISSSLESTFEPVICAAYPKSANFESIQHFCFPNGIRIVQNPSPNFDCDEESIPDLSTTFFVFVLSGGGNDGQDTHYASCMVKWLQLPQNFVLQSEESTLYAGALLKNKLKKLMNAPLPDLGSWMHIDFFSRPLLLERDCSPLLNHRVDESTYLILQWAGPIVFSNISMENVIACISSLLLEMKIIVVCNDLNILTATVLALVSLLAPLTWAGPVIAILPMFLLEYLEAPVPFIIGVQELPENILDIPDLVVLYPQEDRVDFLLEINFPNQELLLNDLNSIMDKGLPPSTDHIDLIAQRIYTFIYSLLNSDSDFNTISQIRATQTYHIYNERSKQISNHPTPLEERLMSRDNNQEEHNWTTLEKCATGIFELAYTGVVNSKPTALPSTLSALDRLRAMHIEKKKPERVVVVIGHLLATSPKYNQALTKSQRHSSPVKETSKRDLINITSPDLSLKPEVKRRSSKTNVQLQTTPIPESQVTSVAEPVATPNTIAPPLKSRENSVKHIQRWWRQRKPKPSPKKSLQNTTKQSISRRFSAPVLLCTQAEDGKHKEYISMFLAGVPVYKLGRRGLKWNKRRLLCDALGEYVMCEKLEPRAATKLKVKSTIAFKDIISITRAMDTKLVNTNCFNPFFSATDDEISSSDNLQFDNDKFCCSIRTNDNTVVVLRLESLDQLDEVHAGLEYLRKLKMPAPSIVSPSLLDPFQSQSFKVDNEKAYLQKFVSDLKVGFFITKHGRQGAPSPRILTCDNDIKFVSIRDPSGKSRAWLRRRDHSNKNIIPIESISDIVLKHDQSPVRQLIYRQTPSSEIIDMLNVVNVAMSLLVIKIKFEFDAMKRATTELPEGWIQVHSKTKNKPFYVHEATGKTQWHIPVAKKLKTPLSEIPTEIVSAVTRAFRVGAAQRKSNGDLAVFQPWQHQIRAVAKIVHEISCQKKFSKNYLVQHSTGSGKSVTIACLAYQLLYTVDVKKQGFHTVIILVDRIKLDQQLGDTVQVFMHQNGVDNIFRAESIDHLSTIVRNTEEQKVIVTTTQKLYQLVNDKVLLARLLYASSVSTTNNLKHLAIIADEAHRSHNDSTRVSVDNVLQALSSESNSIVYIGFSATPSVQALELFGTKTNDSALKPFDTHSMSDAIAQGHIVNVLSNTKFFQPTHGSTILTKVKSMMRHFVKLKTKQVFGKCLVVVRSRKDVVSYHEIIQSYVKAKGWPAQVYCTFSSFDNINEKQLNTCTLALADVIVVCDKLDTGFNEPNLLAMYVDRPLQRHGHIVQLLSRLNRSRPGKDCVYVVDYCNHPLQIRTAFALYAHAKVIQTTKLDRLFWNSIFEMARIMLLDTLPDYKFKNNSYIFLSNVPTISVMACKIIVLPNDTLTQLKYAMSSYIEAASKLHKECADLPLEWVKELKHFIEISSPDNSGTFISDTATTPKDYELLYQGSLDFEINTLPNRYLELSDLLYGNTPKKDYNTSADDALSTKVKSIKAHLQSKSNVA